MQKPSDTPKSANYGYQLVRLFWIYIYGWFLTHACIHMTEKWQKYGYQIILASYIDLFCYATILDKTIQIQLPRDRLSAKETTSRNDSIRTVNTMDALLFALAILFYVLIFTFSSSNVESLILIVFAILIEPLTIYNGKDVESGQQLEPRKSWLSWVDWVPNTKRPVVYFVAILNNEIAEHTR